jgi:succinate-semialdehyde dehydrogenase/glutarate-semialdehyde dehydrogenase
MKFGYKKLYINGQLIDALSGTRKDIICPANEEIVAAIAWAGSEDAEAALIAAQKGFEYWSKLSLTERTQWMLKLRDAILEKEDLLRQAMMYEMGKTYESAWEDIEAVTNGLEWYPAAMKNLLDELIPDYENTHRHKMIHQPAGVAVAYLAWNFPLLNVGFKLGPALAAGCSLIIKPSSISPLSAYILGEILFEINFPAGVVNILAGPSNEVANTLTKSKIPRVITMIGSTQTGLNVIADSATSIKHLSMELGGNAPFIVFDDADIETALNIAIALKFGNCGQVCVAPNRFFIHQSIYKKFISEFVRRTKQLKVGFGINDKLDMGPLVTPFDRDRMIELVEDAVSKGAILETGGKIPKDKKMGYWFEPTVLSNVNHEMNVFRKEVFGPIASFASFETDEQALSMANNTEFGLASYIFTNNFIRIQRFSEDLEFGEVQINGVKYAIYLPHGGIKNSGIGYDCSHLALNDYLIKKRITNTI